MMNLIELTIKIGVNHEVIKSEIVNLTQLSITLVTLTSKKNRMFLRKYLFISSTSDLVMKEILKLSCNEAQELNFNAESYVDIKLYPRSCTTCDF